MRHGYVLALAVLVSPAATHAQAAAVTRLRGDLEAAVAARQIPGAIVVIARGNRVLADITTGWADIERKVPLQRDAIFRFYSMSKPITSVAVIMLAEKQRLALGDPVEKYLPELATMRVYASGEVGNMVTVPARRPITIADLLTHRSGITYHFSGTTPVHQYYRKYGVMRDTPVGRMPGDGAPARTLAELVSRIGRAPLLHQPGETFAYSYSTTVLGAVIERVTGERLDRHLDRMIFRPLGMKDTGFYVSDAQLPRFTTLYGPGMTPIELPAASDYRDTGRLLDGGGAITGTANDYLRFARMLANGGILNGKRLLSEKSVDALFAPHARIAGMGTQAVRFGYGFAIGDAASEAAGTQPAGTASWSGSGNTYFYVDRSRRTVALLMTHVLGSSGTVRASVNRAAIALTRD